MSGENASSSPKVSVWSASPTPPWAPAFAQAQHNARPGRGDLGSYVRPPKWTHPAIFYGEWREALQKHVPGALVVDELSAETPPRRLSVHAGLKSLRSSVNLPLSWCTHRLWLLAPPLVAPLPAAQSELDWAGPATWAFLALSHHHCRSTDLNPRRRALALAQALALTAPVLTLMLPLHGLAVATRDPGRGWRSHRLPVPLLVTVQCEKVANLQALDAAILQAAGLRLEADGLQRRSSSATPAPISSAAWQAYRHWLTSFGALVNVENRVESAWIGWADHSWQSSIHGADR